MRAGNPAPACTLCFCLPAQTNSVFCQQFDHFPIMRNISEQSNQFSAQSPQFPKQSNCYRKVCEQKKTKIKMIFYRYNTRLCATY